MIIKVYFTDRIYRLGLMERVSRVIEVKKVGKNRLSRTVKKEAFKKFPMMDFSNYEVLS